MSQVNKPSHMTTQEIALEISKREGKLKGVDIAQLNEVVAIVGDMFYEGKPEQSGDLAEAFFHIGRKRANLKRAHS